MKRFLVMTTVAVVVALGVVSLGSMRLTAQTQTPAKATPAIEQKDVTPDPNWKPEGPVPRRADGHPDLSGVWWSGGEVAVISLTNIGTDGGRTAANGNGPRPNGFGSKYKPEY